MSENRENRDREKFHEFLHEIGLKGAFHIHTTLTQTTDPKLRFKRIEKFIFSMITMAELEAIIDYCKKNNLGLYLAFDNLCIGYPEEKLQTRIEVF